MNTFSDFDDEISSSQPKPYLAEKRKRAKLSERASTSTSTEKEEEEGEQQTKYDVVVGKDAREQKLAPGYNVYVGGGYAIEVKEFRKSNYLCLSKQTNGELRNRLNLPVAQAGNLKKALEHVIQHLKHYE